ncbi:hypothetical protein [Catenulispora subtropica]|uniref:Uncharacterized protein n=1 Tax=Catenulispora subtropica TaxID=450798 RepID=A0ABN2SR91_9ACTN
MRTTRKLAVVGAALLGAAVAAAPAHADQTVTKCSNWKLSGTHYLQSCIDVTGTQVHTYGYVSAAGTTAPDDVDATMTGRLGSPGTRLAYQPSTVHLDADTVLVDGTTTTAAAGTPVRATLFLPHTLGTGTLVGPDNAVFLDPDVPSGPVGPGGQSSTLEQITVWATVTG